MLKDIQVQNQKETRGGFGEGIYEVGKANKDIVVLTADLAGSLKLGPFMKEFPDRYVQCGIAEANMMGIGAGLTIGGKIPYTTTFANFSTGRVYDQIRQSIAYSNKNVKICASHVAQILLFFCCWRSFTVGIALCIYLHIAHKSFCCCKRIIIHREKFSAAK